MSTRQSFYLDSSHPLPERVENLLSMMTLKEKVAQIQYTHGKSVGLLPDQAFREEDLAQEHKRRISDGVGSIFIAGSQGGSTASGQAASLNRLQHMVLEHSRLNIPLLVHAESLHGLNAGGATMFPQAIALASTWNPSLVKEIFQAISQEMRSRGIHVTYAPVLDIGTDPRWGRIQETFGEDPYLTTQLGLAAVRGYQGDNPGYLRVMAVAKHFAGYGQAQGGRNFAPAPIPHRMLFNQILPPFKVAVEDAGLEGIMAAHHELDGIPCHGNRFLLADILRRKWGFQGLLLSDNDDIYRLSSFHRIVNSQEEAARLAMECGIDIEILESRCYADLEELIKQGVIDINLLDQAVSRILRIKFLLGLFDTPYVDPSLADEINQCPEHLALSRRAARESMVLLKNEGELLPLDHDDLNVVAVIGPNATTTSWGTYAGKGQKGSSILAGLQDKLGDLITLLYAEGCAITKKVQPGTMSEKEWQQAQDNPSLCDPQADAAKIKEAVEIAQKADLAILCVGGDEKTGREAYYNRDHRGDRDALDLVGAQNVLINAISKTGTPFVLILVNGRPLSIPDQVKQAKAVLETWFIGTEIGECVADALFGDLNPNGKLPLSFPRSVGQIPIYYNHKPSGRHRNYLFVKNSPLFPFGYGLSYTRFDYHNLTIAPATIQPSGSLTVEVEVSNDGERPGEEIVQLYIRDEVSSATRPVKELKGFKKIKLDPGETKTIQFVLSPEHLGFYNADYEFTVEPGTFKIMVGPNSQEGLKGQFVVSR